MSASQFSSGQPTIYGLTGEVSCFLNGALLSLLGRCPMSQLTRPKVGGLKNLRGSAATARLDGTFTPTRHMG
jgi:hypothetical protein